MPNWSATARQLRLCSCKPVILGEKKARFTKALYQPCTEQMISLTLPEQTHKKEKISGTGQQNVENRYGNKTFQPGLIIDQCVAGKCPPHPNKEHHCAGLNENQTMAARGSAIPQKESYYAQKRIYWRIRRRRICPGASGMVKPCCQFRIRPARSKEAVKPAVAEMMK